MKIIHILFSILIFSAFCNTNLNPNTRSSILAGRWYPANRENLESTIDNLLKNSETAHSAKQPILLILPHAGYIYSGKVAAVGYNLIKKLSPDIIIIIAPSHYSSFYGCSILPVDYYETPLGKVRIAKDAVKFLLNQNLFQYNRHAHTQEHAIEIHLPFIQRIFENKLLNNIVILPILIGNINSTNAVEISHSIVNAINNKKNPLFIISSDFTHFGERFGYLPFNSQDRNTIKQKIKQLDHGAIDRILAKDIKGFTEYIKKTEATICGRNAIMVALSMPINNFKARLAAYDTSGNITGDFNNSVSYSAIVVSGTIEKNAMKHGNSKNSDFNLSQDDKKFLLNLARNNIESLLYKNKTIKIKKQNVPQNCKKMAGAFITLKKKGRLRGCIGYVMGIKPLYQTVIDNSGNAALKDPRFPSLGKDEFADISIEISVLTIPRLVNSINEIEVGRDGLIIEQGFRKGLLLPQVPVEWHWNKEQFLIHTCRKAGLPDYAWKHGAKIYKFQAIVFGENEDEK